MFSSHKTCADRLRLKSRLPSRFLAAILACLSLAIICGDQAEARLAAQAETEVAPDAVPQVQRVNPNQAAPGDEVTVTIDGQNFSSGAYVSFSDPSIRIISTRRASPTQLEAKLAINKKAQPGAVTLYVSNPASTVAQSPFTIVAGVVPPAPSIAPTQPAKPASEVQPADAGIPVVSQVEPPSAARGGAATLKITGKNFATGARISFSNPDIKVKEAHVAKATEMTVSIQIAPDAKTGVTSLFVVNPDDREVEASFSVTESSSTKETVPTTGGIGTAKGPGTAKGTAGDANSAEQTFSVYNLGEGASILHRTKGNLVIGGGKLKYEEKSEEVFSTPLAEIKEVEENIVFGVKTGTFHIILTGGKTYNFIASSLRPADTQVVVSALQSKLK
jgi:hypothetical protein